MSQIDIDYYLPKIEKHDQNIPIAFTVWRIGEDHFLISAGSFWRKRADEFGRQGLVGWNSIILPKSDITNDNLQILFAKTNSLIKALHNFHHDIGLQLEDIACHGLPEDPREARLRSIFRDNELEDIAHFGKVPAIPPSNSAVKVHHNLYTYRTWQDQEIAIYQAIRYFLSNAEIDRVVGGSIDSPNPSQNQILVYEDADIGIMGKRPRWKIEISEILTKLLWTSFFGLLMIGFLTLAIYAFIYIIIDIIIDSF